MQHRERAADGQVVVRADPAWQPPVLSPSLLAAAHRLLPEIEAYMAPAVDAELAVEIDVLFAHFYVPSMDQELQTRVIGNWLDDLAHYPLWTLQAAAREWRRNKERRPTLAEFIRECEFWASGDRTELELLRKLIAAQPKPDVPPTTH